MGLHNKDLFSSYRLDTRVLENDFMEKFSKFADPVDGLVTAKRFATYLHLPVDHPKAMELFDIYDSVYTTVERAVTYGNFMLNDIPYNKTP